MKLQKLALMSMLAGAAAIVACSHGPEVQPFPDTASASQEVMSLNADISKAVENQVNVFSPNNFANAANARDDAKTMLESGDDSADILHRVAQGRAYLTRANEVTQTARESIEDVVKARQDARAAGAPGFFATDFNEADDKLRKVAADMEDGDGDSVARNRSEMQADYLALELDSIKVANLRPARLAFDDAVREGGKEYAPQSLALAERNLMDTDAFITANRHERPEIHARASAALASAQYALRITQLAKRGNSNEQMAIQLDREERQVMAKNSELNAKQRELRLKQGELTEAESRLNLERSNLSALTDEKASLESEKEFNERFEKARGMFTENEAEVYRQGDKLIIRLKGMEFSKNQADIRGENFSLLSKVDEVIQDFGQSSVVVEGHTDSQGGQAVNEKLSAKRAEAVEKYLVSKNPILEDDIEAVGYGYSKPIATNKTPQGRAQNRRVDVVISPEKSANF